MKQSGAAIALSALLAPAMICAADDPIYEVDWAAVQQEGFVPYSGMAGHPTVQSLYADDFTLSQGAAVDRVAWFGYSDYWDFPDLTNFTQWEVRIYVGQGPGVEPGQMIYQKVFDKHETNPTAIGPHGLYGATMYRHEVELGETLQLEAGQYWIGIGADAISGASDWWIWAQAPPGDETIARWIWADQEWMIQGPDWNPDYPTFNVAFEIFGDMAPSVPGDLNGDGVVDVSDLLILLSEWGPCPPAGDCPADLNGDGVVDVSDLIILLSNWS